MSQYGLIVLVNKIGYGNGRERERGGGDRDIILPVTRLLSEYDKTYDFQLST